MSGFENQSKTGVDSVYTSICKYMQVYASCSGVQLCKSMQVMSGNFVVVLPGFEFSAFKA